MNKKITINQAVIENNQLHFITNEAITGFIPKGHMLVDSDHFSFIYIMEENDSYIYVVLGESIWVALREAINGKLPAFLLSNQEQIELISFQEELEYVISNIKGNGNYGEAMVEKIETIF